MTDLGGELVEAQLREDIVDQHGGGTMLFISSGNHWDSESPS
jgi:hypothetical protein